MQPSLDHGSAVNPFGLEDHMNGPRHLQPTPALRWGRGFRASKQKDEKEIKPNHSKKNRTKVKKSQSKGVSQISNCLSFSISSGMTGSQLLSKAKRVFDVFDHSGFEILH